MRRVLILGGTGWLGREVAAAAVAAGAEVVCVARGESGTVATGAQLIRADRRQPGAYDAVAGDWDDVVEIAYDLDLVGSALEALAERAAHWTLVSSVSVYARSDEPFADESAEVVQPTDLTQYAEAKVAAERLTASQVGDRLLLARPGLIVGPGDPTDRFGYWPARLRRGGQTLVPTTTERAMQVIDVADLATWIERAGRDGVVGAVNAVGDVHGLGDFLDLARIVVGFDGELVAVDDATLLDLDVRHWAGPRSLPLWLPAEDTGFLRRDNTAYLSSGGVLRTLAETLRRTLADETSRGLDRPRRSGLTAAEERAVLAALPRG